MSRRKLRSPQTPRRPAAANRKDGSRLATHRIVADELNHGRRTRAAALFRHRTCASGAAVAGRSPVGTSMHRRVEDLVLVIVLMPLLLYVTFPILSVLGINLVGLVSPIIDPIIRWVLAGSKLGQGAIIFIFVWVGPWLVAVFCLACLATYYINAWWDRRGRQ
jgi:hypothetical protein